MLANLKHLPPGITGLKANGKVTLASLVPRPGEHFVNADVKSAPAGGPQWRARQALESSRSSRTAGREAMAARRTRKPRGVAEPFRENFRQFEGDVRPAIPNAGQPSARGELLTPEAADFLPGEIA